MGIDEIILEQNGTTCKWVYRMKQEAHGSKCYKARLVVKENDIFFSLVVKLTTINLILYMATTENLLFE